MRGSRRGRERRTFGVTSRRRERKGALTKTSAREAPLCASREVYITRRRRQRRRLCVRMCVPGAKNFSGPPRASNAVSAQTCVCARARAQLGACLLYFRSFLRSARPTPASSPSRSRKNRGRAREIRMKTAARAESVNGEKGSLSGENSIAAHSDPKERERERETTVSKMHKRTLLKRSRDISRDATLLRSGRKFAGAGEIGR